MPFFAWFLEYLRRGRSRHFAVIPSAHTNAIRRDGAIWRREAAIRSRYNEGQPLPVGTLGTLPLYNPERTRRGNAYFGQEPYNYREYSSAKVVPLAVTTDWQGTTLIQIPKLKQNRETGQPDFDFSKESGSDPMRYSPVLPSDDFSESPILATTHYYHPDAPWPDRRQLRANVRPYTPRYYATSVVVKGRLRWSLCRCRFRPVNPDIMIPNSETQAYYIDGTRVHIYQGRYSPQEYGCPPGSWISPHLGDNPARPGEPRLRRFIVFTRKPTRDPGPKLFDNWFFRAVLSQNNRLRLRRLFTRGYDQADLGNLVAIAPVQEPGYPASALFTRGRYDTHTDIWTPVPHMFKWVPLRPILPDPYQERFRKWIKGVTTQARGVRDICLYPLDFLQHYRILPRAQDYYISPLDRAPEPGRRAYPIRYEAANYHPLSQIRYLTFTGMPALAREARPRPRFQIRVVRLQPTSEISLPQEGQEFHPRQENQRFI